MIIPAAIRVACQAAALTTPDRCSPLERALPSPGFTLVQSLDGDEQPECRSRELTGRVLACLGIDPDMTYQAQLAVQELATNARRHAPPPHELYIAIRTRDVKIAVTDADPRHEVVSQLLAAAISTRSEQDTSLLSESGRGLRIIASLFPGACGADPARTACGSRQAKQVWIIIPLPVR